MGGIFFYDLHESAHAVSDTVWAAIDAIKHRGPDASATQIVTFDGKLYLMAFHRLAIIHPDGAAGMQPVHAHGGTLICNGEIYNYLDLADAYGVDPSSLGSDVHILVHALVTSLDHVGVCNVLNKVDGEFALVFCDNSKIIVARDPWGVRPLFFGRNSAGMIIAFASEAKALIGSPKVTRIEVFPPGHVMIFEHNTFTCMMFHQKRARTQLLDHTGTHSNKDQMRELLHAAISKRISHSDRPVGILCSGGLNSSIVTALAATAAMSPRRVRDKLRHKLRVFTIAYSSALSQDAFTPSEDAFYAQLLCSACCVTHEVVSFNAGDVLDAIEPVIRACETHDPNTIRAAIPMFLLAKHIATNTDVKVVLSGEGADELFGGFAYMRNAPTAHALNHETQRLMRQLHMFDILRVDRCFAAFGLEVRVPFLDIDLVEFVTHMPRVETSTKEKDFVEKGLLRDAFRETESLVGKCLCLSRVIDRPKVKLSDGCGFDYVPQLLSYLGGKAQTLRERLSAERSHFGRVFERIFGKACRSLIADRVMPEWEVIWEL